MQRNIRRNLLFAVTAILLLGTSLIAVRFSARADLNARGTLDGQFAPLVQQAHLLQAADGNQQLNLSIGLQLRRQADLDSLLQAMYDPQSTQYHQYLTPGEFNQLFAPTSDQVQQVVAFLQSQGLAVTGIAPNNLLIDATGIVAQVQKAFDTQINTYQSGNHTFYANATAPSIPGSINQLITSISGLDHSVQYYPLYQRAHMYPQAIHAQYTQQHSIQRRLNTYFAGPGSGYGPKELARAYNISQLQNACKLGANQ